VQIYCTPNIYLCTVNGKHPRWRYCFMSIILYILCAIAFIPEVLSEKRYVYIVSPYIFSYA
jgi:hypothetical protein